MERNSKEWATRMVDLESRRYLSEIGLVENLNVHYSVPVASYILCSYMALPVKTIIVGERPYSTRIHPAVSSAMSYDPDKSGSTPSTMGVAADLSGTLGVTHLEVERWFRDSWKYLNSGTVVVNCNIFLPFSSPHSLTEIVPFQRWVRSLIDYSLLISDYKITVICMGVPSSNVIDAVLKSLGTTRSRVSKMAYPNPAIWSKTKRGDSTSRISTFGKKQTSKAILTAIERSRGYLSLTVQDYITELNTNMTSHQSQVTRVIDSANVVASEIDDAFKELEGNHKVPAIKEAVSEFTKALVEYRDTVIRDMVAYRIAAAGDNSSKIGKSTEWGSKKPWKKTVPSVGTSSRMSVLSEQIEQTEGVAQKFADEEDGTEVTFADEAASPALAATEKPKKKKKVVKKMVRRSIASNPEERTVSKTEVGSKLDEAGVGTLRTVIYYLSDVYPDKSASLQAEINKSLETTNAESSDVCVIVDTASMDLKNTGSSASVSLGVEDGEVSDTCMLPKLLARLSELRG